MLTFLDLHNTVLKFVNYRLFTQAGLKYPPTVDHKDQIHASKARGRGCSDAGSARLHIRIAESDLVFKTLLDRTRSTSYSVGTLFF